ncbi:hypothetical protein D3C78_1416920 [compost metagenome]
MFELGRCVPIRIDTDQHHLQPLHGLFRQLAFYLTQLRQRSRADVRAEGIAEEQQRPLALELIHRHGLTFLVGHLDTRHRTALRQQDNAGINQLGRVAFTAAVEHFVDGKPEDHGDQGNEDEDGFLGSSHRFNSK